MAMTIRSENFIRYANSTDISEVTAEIITDTSAELPAADDIPGKKLHQGSIAFIVKEGKLVILSGDDKWIDCSGNVVRG